MSGKPDRPADLRGLFSANAPDESLEPDDRSALAKVEAGLFGGTQRPLTLSRYVLRQRLGAGGAGVVYEAYDPELDRKVAIKLLNARRTRQADVAEARTRLVREARAMARLSHPNVIAVYDVGTYDEGDLSPEAAQPLGRANGVGVFVVMELIEGQTLTEWLETPRPWGEVVAHFVAAGRGLAAAHEAGLIHRDFKLDNVLLGEDGRVCVLDFGLARAQFAGQPEAAVTETAGRESNVEHSIDVHGPTLSPDALSSQLTMMGTVLGTPNYMAPEQHRAGPSDARTDQYSFCVALYIALFGERPFDAKTFEGLGVAKQEGRVRPVPADSPVPKVLVELVTRGLSADPEARYDSMEALLAELAQNPHASRKRLVAAGAVLGGVSLLVGGALAWQAHQESVCQDYDRAIESVWDRGAVSTMQQSFAATELPFASATFDSTKRILNEFATSWVEQRARACKIERDRGQEPREITDRRIACLDVGLRTFEATVQVLLEGDSSVAEHAVTVAAALESPDTCGDLERLASGTTQEDVAGRSEVEALVARARALRMARQAEDSRQVAEQSVAAAREHGLERLEAKALLQLGEIRAGTAAEDGAEILREALRKAERLGEHETSTQVMIQLIYVLGWSLSRTDEADWFAELARARLEHRPLAGLHASELEAHVAVLRFAQGRFDEALQASLEALSRTEAVVGAEHPRMATMHHSVGNRLRALERLEEARARYERALEIRERHLGPHHPALGAELEGLASVDSALGEFASAETRLTRSLTALEGAFGKDTPRSGFTQIGLGGLYHKQARYLEALSHYEKALLLQERRLGPTHLATIEAHMGIGACLIALGRLDEARKGIEHGLAMAEEAGGPDHPSTADMLALLADVLSRQGEHEPALRNARRAIQIHDAAHGEGHSSTAHPLIVEARTHLALSQPKLARAAAERAIESVRNVKGNPVLRGDARFVLARALTDADTSRAMALAEQALAIYASDVPEHPNRRAITAWIAERKPTQ